jgi:signal transduction histidine kinase
MDAILAIYVSAFLLSALVCVGSVPRALRIRHPGTREGLVSLLLSCALWAGGYVGYLLAPSNPLRRAFYLFGLVFAFVTVGAWLYFSAAYTGRSPRRAPYRRLAVGVFLLVVGLKLTNPVHGLFFTTEWVTEPFPHLAIRHGPLHWVVLAFSYALSAVSFFVLLERFHYAGTDTRPLVGLVALTGIPVVVNLVSLTDASVLPLLYEPVGVATFAVGTLFVYARRFQAVQFASNTDEPAVVLDQDGSIREYNRAASARFPELDGVVGRPLREVLPRVADRRGDGDDGVVAIERDGETRYYRVTTTPLMSGEVATGELLVVSDVTESERYRTELEAKTEQLEALNRVVRHDIRNDMAVVLGWAETLHDHVDEDGTEALERVIRKANHVVELTDISRDFVDTMTGEGDLELQSVALREHLELELEAVRDSYPHADVRVVDGIPSVSVRANGMLSSVFRNLLNNAVQHSDEEAPTVTVDADVREETVRVRVADDGPGIPDDRKELVFGKGERGLDSEGTGVGLYLVQTLLEQFGGDVWVEDNEPTGAVFVVELRRADA